MLLRRPVFLFALSALLFSMGCSAEEPGETEVSEPEAVLEEQLSVQLRALTEPAFGDLDAMVTRNVIRTLVVPGGPQFFYYQGKPRGMITELLGMLQQELNAALGLRHDQVEIVPMPVSRDQLIPMLLSGQADLIAADLTITEARSQLVEFSMPFVTGVDEVVVFAPGKGGEVQSVDDLSGQDIFVRKSSSYFEHLSGLNAVLHQRGLNPINIVEANEFLRVQDILEMVNAGLVDATVIDSHKATGWSDLLTDMVVRDDLVLKSGGRIAWAYRKDSPQLAEQINEFARGHRKGTLLGNVLIERYMGNLKWVRNSTSDVGIERLQTLARHFQASADETNIEWLMLVAQAYQESELDNSRKSSAGAVGIMQIKPSTAADKHVSIDDISAPADNIRAGAKYMRFLMDRYFSEPGMDGLQQWLFGLAAYNAGPAKVRRLRNQAAKEGYDPDRWTDNVEVIAAKEIGRETIRYVRNVFKYYVAYELAWEERQSRAQATE